MFGHVPVKVSPHNSLNSCKGVIRHFDLRNATEQEILEDLKDFNMTAVQRISVTRNGNRTQTNTFILTFIVPKLPSEIKVCQYIKCKVEPYVPNPLRCFNCQRFGHHKEKCSKQMVCARCGQDGHDLISCENPLQCPNCKGDHFAYSKECPKWKQEKEIQTVKVKRNITFKEARKQVESRTPGGPSAQSYADAARPAPVQTERLSCKTLVDKLCSVFPEKANEIRQILKSSQPSQPSSNTSPSQSNQNKTPDSPKKDPKQIHKPQTNQKQLSEKPTKPPKPQKPAKVNTTSHQKIDLPQNAVKKNTSMDSAKSGDKKGRINLPRLSVDESSNLVTLPAPPTANQFQPLEDMEDDASWEHKKLPDWNDDIHSWDNSKTEVSIPP